MTKIDDKKLLDLAKKASKKAYAPYSQFPVGACVLAKSGKTYCGCNVENASYGLGICAERNAIANAIQNGETEILATAIYSPKMEDCSPCGACRQVLFEFSKDGKMQIITEAEKETKKCTIEELLPSGFRL